MINNSINNGFAEVDIENRYIWGACISFLSQEDSLQNSYWWIFSLISFGILLMYCWTVYESVRNNEYTLQVVNKYRDPISDPVKIELNSLTDFKVVLKPMFNNYG